MGGYSSEYEISLESGNLIYQHMDRDEFDVFQVHIFKKEWFVKTDTGEKIRLDKGDFSVEMNGEKIHFDCVFNIIHGTPGEDGLFPGYLQTLGIPQTASDYYQAALTFNKRDCISVLQNYGFKTAKNYMLDKGDEIDEEAILEKVGLPCFVKANRGGSSFGISKVKEKNKLSEAIEFSFKEDNEVIIESFLDGTEVSVGVVNYQGEIRALPVTEIVTENEFFDYEAKYLGQSKEITPARLSEKQTEDVQQQTERIFKLLKLKGFARAEFIFHNGEPHFIEINTCPGMTAASIVPQQLKAAGIPLKAFFSDVVNGAIGKF